MPQSILPPFRENVEKQVDRNLVKLNTGKHQVCHLGRNNISHQGRMKVNWLEGSFAEEDLGGLVDKVAKSQQCGLAAKEVTSLLAALGRASPTGQGRCSVPSSQHWCLVSHSRLLGTRQAQTYWSESSKGPIE